MSGPSPEELAEADGWLREAKEEFAVAAHVHSDSQLPSRVVCFHAHLAAEKALKSIISELTNERNGDGQAEQPPGALAHRRGHLLSIA